MKIETGVMVAKDGSGWGKTYEVGHHISYGWVPLEDAITANPELCKKSTDMEPIGMLSKDGSYINELALGQLVHVKRTTTVEIKIENMEWNQGKVPYIPRVTFKVWLDSGDVRICQWRDSLCTTGLFFKDCTSPLQNSHCDTSRIKAWKLSNH